MKAWRQVPLLLVSRLMADNFPREEVLDVRGLAEAVDFDSRDEIRRGSWLRQRVGCVAVKEGGEEARVQVSE